MTNIRPTEGALVQTVIANDAAEACREAAGRLLNCSLSAAAEMFNRAELEVVAVIKGDPQFDVTKRTPPFLYRILKTGEHLSTQSTQWIRAALLAAVRTRFLRRSAATSTVSIAIV